MGICYTTYRKWAKYYKVFDQHLNQKGDGIKKGFAVRTVNVEDVVLGKRQPPQRWSQSVVKEELIDKGYWQDECTVCGYNETNLETDKVCLGIDFSDGNSKNWLLDNIRLLCVNCYYSFNDLCSNFSCSSVNRAAARVLQIKMFLQCWTWKLGSAPYLSNNVTVFNFPASDAAGRAQIINT